MRLPALALLILAAAAPASNVDENIIGPPIPPRPPGFEALSWPGRADRLLRDHDDVALVATYERALEDNGAQAMLDWAGRRLTNDDRHAIIADLIGNSYQQAVDVATDPVKRIQTLRAAAIYKLIAVGLTLVDGAACADPTAPQERNSERLANGKPVLDWLRQTTAPLRADIIGRALAVESATFGKAPPDPDVCWAGHDIWQHADMKARHVIDSRDADGRTITRFYVPTQPGWSPPLRSDALATRQAAQNNLRAELEKLAKPAS
jgi:hypothetical protein